jgi:hypothetical protein
MNPSNPNRHRQTTSLVTGAGHYGHCVEDQICWGIKKFVHKHPAAHRVVGLLVTGADNQTRTPTPPQPLTNTRGDGAHYMSQIRTASAPLDRLIRRSRPATPVTNARRGGCGDGSGRSTRAGVDDVVTGDAPGAALGIPGDVELDGYVCGHG